jgi:transcription elongation GreA/GreB family factor
MGLALVGWKVGDVINWNFRRRKTIGNLGR